MKIKFYGATWCPDCKRSRQFLDEKGVEYEYINIEEVPGAAEEVEKINKGYQSIPTIIFPDGQVLVEPSNVELQKALDANQDFIITHKGEKR
ncbi:MAG: glutathione S-transferase N-terminal domain-containing protein [Candidatus Levybacteria bacterium]|nr:glutathione S-transferase N-terminal domain-containing protein [Candidatus Levybacteria bacterium]